MGETDDEPEKNDKCVHEGWSDLREKKRGCTDCLFSLLLIAVWVGMTIIGLIVLGAIQDDHLSAGNPYRLTNTIDYAGNICGISKSVKDKSKGYYMLDGSAICVEECPKKANYEKFLCQYGASQDSADASISDGYQLVIDRKCMYEIETKEFINRCLPNMDTSFARQAAESTAANYSVTYQDAFTYSAGSDGKGWFNNFLADILTLQGYIFGFGFGFATGIAFGYLYLLRIPGLLFFLVWTAILGIFLLMLIGSILLLSLADSWSKDGEHSNPEVYTMRFFGGFCLAVTGLYFCMVLVMRKRVQLAIGIVKQAAKALATMPALLFLPVIQAIGLFIFIIPWIIYVLFLASSGQISTVTGSYDNMGTEVTYSYREFTYTTNTKYAFLYMIFCFFWTSEFILAFGQMAVALSFAGWYFTRDKSTVGNSTVFWACRATLWYHSGTVAFGSLIIAIIKTIRVVIAYIQRQAKRSKNKILEYVMMCLQCLMWCLEKIMKFINKHAYILTAIYGYSFCKSARKAFWLLLRNILRVAAVNMLSSFVLFMGRLLIPVATTFICYLALAYGTNTSAVSGIVCPLVFVFLLSYWVASMFLEIFAMGIETILFCFIADEEMFKLEDRFASGELMTSIQQTAQQAASLKIHPAGHEPIQEAEPVKDNAPDHLGGNKPPPAGDVLM